MLGLELYTGHQITATCGFYLAWRLTSSEDTSIKPISFFFFYFIFNLVLGHLVLKLDLFSQLFFRTSLLASLLTEELRFVMSRFIVLNCVFLLSVSSCFRKVSQPLASK